MYRRDKTEYKRERKGICEGRRHTRVQVLVMSNVQRDKAKKWSYDIGEGTSDVGRTDEHKVRK